MQFNNINVFSNCYLRERILLKSGGNSVSRIGNTLMNSKIELTPHQINAALFAFKSPLDKGVILADEVGLGKTIEAGIVITQLKYEKNAKILIVSPASLMKQWEGELEDKFGLNVLIMDRKQYNLLKRNGHKNPFVSDTDVIICSYQMCSVLGEDIFKTPFDLVVIDEAHKLRNVHNPNSQLANNVKNALCNKKKLLLTATPIQNNLLDLYGLASIIDENIFGDKASFRFNYIKNLADYESDLEDRLKLFVHRTLRSQVSNYIKFTNRIPKTFSFEHTSDEEIVYQEIRALIQKSDNDEVSYLFPKSQKHLVVLILCKLLGSSIAAIISTLSKMLVRLNNIKVNHTVEALTVLDEYDEIESDDFEEEDNQIQEIDFTILEREIAYLENIIEKAKRITYDSKFKKLLEALSYSFSHLKETGAAEKVLIFTESKKTQDYLFDELKNNGFSDILRFNGTNNDEYSQKIYASWIENHPDEKNSRTIVMRDAIINSFKRDGKILLATEAGAEGLNLQFCSLVINYDLPWNPQRVEQRIGRCHRLGQKHDVVVINFINKSNAVEQRIYDLLSEKFRVFDEILGSSDSVIGNLDDSKDLENSIVEIYKKCRSENEIDEAFSNLQSKYKDEIEASLRSTRDELFANFEEDVQALFDNVMGQTEAYIDGIEALLWRLARNIISGVVFDEKLHSFTDQTSGENYFLMHTEEKGKNMFNSASSLGKRVLEYAKQDSSLQGKIVFDISNYPYKLSKIEGIKGHRGMMILNKVCLNSLENEEYLVFNGILDDGTRIETDVFEKLFRLETVEKECLLSDSNLLVSLERDCKINVENVVNQSQEKNNKLISQKIEQINAWADDLIESTQLKVEEMRAQRKELQKQSDIAPNMQEKEKIEEEIVSISKKIKNSWIKLADEEEEIETRRKKMIEDIRREVNKETKVNRLFCVEFEVV